MFFRTLALAAILFAAPLAHATDQEMTFNEALEGLKEFGIVTQEATQEAWETAPERLDAEIERMQADIDQAGDDASDASKQALQDLKEIRDVLGDQAAAAAAGADETAEGVAASFRDFFTDVEGAWKTFWE